MRSMISMTERLWAGLYMAGEVQGNRGRTTRWSPCSRVPAQNRMRGGLKRMKTGCGRPRRFGRTRACKRRFGARHDRHPFGDEARMRMPLFAGVLFLGAGTALAQA